MKSIIVGVPTCADAVNEFKCCLEEFRKKNLPVRRSDRIRTRIETSNCIIMFVPINPPDRLCGLRVDAIFGFSKEDQCYYTQSHQPTEYNGTFLDYVYEIENIKEKRELPRYERCPSCGNYNTTYPYCDTCVDGNRFRPANNK